MKNLYKLTLLQSIIFLSLFSYSHDGVQKGFHFTENKGQFWNNVAFHSKLHVGDMFLEKDRITFDLFSASEMDSLINFKHTSREEKSGIPQISKRPSQNGRTPLENKFKKHLYSMVFNGANKNTNIIANNVMSGYKNYYIGNDKSRWVNGAKSYKSVKYNNLYNGIDMEIYSEFEWMKYDFIVHPGANPDDIKINYEGVDQLRIVNNELIISLSTGEIKEVKLIAYQNINGRQVSVPCNFKQNGNQISYDFPNGYDANYELIIDPVWIFSTLTGSTADNWGFTATYDTLGNLFAAGIAFGSPYSTTGYPTTSGAYSSSSLGGNFDISITKFDSLGQTIIYSTYLGGSDNEMPHSLVHDSQNNLVLLGSSGSSDYPTFGSPYDATFNNGFPGTFVNMWGYQYANGCDIVLTKLNSTGGLLNSTFIGGSDNEGLNESMVYNYADQGRGELYLDANDNIYVATSLWSNDFPVTNGSTMNGTGTQIAQDAVVFKMNSTLSTLNWATYLGGSGYDAGYSIRVSDQGIVYVCGGTTSSDLGVTPGVINSTYGGSWDGYIASYDANTGNAIAKTYLGTDYYDQSFILENDENGNVYVVGQTLGDYPVFNAAYSEPNSSQFIHKINADLTTTAYSTVFGSPGNLTYGGSTTSCDLTLTLYDSYGDGWNGGVVDIYINGIYYNTYTFNAGYSFTFQIPVNVGDGVTAFFTAGGWPEETSYTISNSQGMVLGSGADTDISTPIIVTECSDFISGSVNISPTAFLVDNCGNVYVSGWGGGFNNAYNGSAPYSPMAGGNNNNMDIAGTQPAYQSTTDGSDFYFFVLERDATGLLYGSYFGDPIAAEHTDGGTSRFDPQGVIYQSVCATCGSGSFPTGPGSVWNSSNPTVNIGAPPQTYNICNMGAIKFEFDFQGIEAIASAPSDTTLCSSPPFALDFNSDGSTPSVFWDFGDGNTSNQQNPTNNFADSGTYQVMFVAIDLSSCNIRDTAYFNVTLNQAPTFDANFNLPLIPPCSDPSSVLVNAGISGTGIDSIQWDMGDSSPLYTNVDTISHQYLNPGIYDIEVIAWDLTCDFTDTITETFNFLIDSTTAIATVPPDTTLCTSPPFNMNFTSDGSTPDVFWDFGDGNTSILQNPSNSFADSGTYNIMFIAIDSNTCNIADTAYFNVEILQAATFNAQINVPSIPPCTDPTLVPLTATFTGSGADSISWDLGDGTVYADSTSFTYYYANPGVYTVTMTAWDFTCNNTNSVSQVVDFNSVFSTATATAPPDTTLCSSPPFVMNFSSDGSTPDVFWDFGDGNTSTLQNPSNSFADSGSYNIMFIAIDSSTCNIADTAFFNVEILQAATFNAQINVPNIPPCSDPTLVPINASFTGSGADSLSWDLGDGTFYNDSLSFTYFYANPGVYTITMTAWDFTCNNTNSVSQVVDYTSSFSTATATAPPDTTLCSLPPFNMNFSSDGSTPDVFWDFGDGNTSTLQNPSNAYADSGLYQVMFIAIDSTTCNIADTVFFDVDIMQAPTFNASFSLPVIPPCTSPDSVTLVASFSGTGLDSIIWDMGDGTIIYDSTSIAYNYTNEGLYDIIVTAWGSCNSDTTISQTFNFNTDSSLAVAYAPEDTTLCTLPPFTIDFTSNGTNPSQTWDFGDGNSSTDANPSHSFADTGNYLVTYIAIDSNTCNIYDTATFNVTLIQAEQFSAVLDFEPPPPCGIDSMLVELAFTGTGADSLIWDMGNGSIFNDSAVNYYYTVPGAYDVSLTAYDMDCDIVETISETVFFAGNFNTEDIIPNVFTPNGDGDNDQLTFIRVNDTKYFSIIIYNRWGAVIYQSNNANISWDGRSPGGKDASAGIYYFEIRYTDQCSDDERLETGFFHLMR